MRTEKFAPQDENSYAGDDINCAFYYNDLDNKLKDIDVIVAEVAGENDGNNWYWILKMTDGTYAWATGGCDYTGWDCQSSAEIHEGFKAAYDAWENLTIQEYDDRRGIKRCLMMQLIEEQPFALYDEITL